MRGGLAQRQNLANSGDRGARSQGLGGELRLVEGLGRSGERRTHRRGPVTYAVAGPALDGPPHSPLPWTVRYRARPSGFVVSARATSSRLQPTAQSSQSRRDSRRSRRIVGRRSAHGGFWRTQAGLLRIASVIFGIVRAPRPAVAGTAAWSIFRTDPESERDWSLRADASPARSVAMNLHHGPPLRSGPAPPSDRLLRRLGQFVLRWSRSPDRRRASCAGFGRSCRDCSPER